MAGWLFLLFLPLVRRYVELFCLCTDTVQDCGNGNLRALTALVFTLQTAHVLPCWPDASTGDMESTEGAQLGVPGPPCLTQSHDLVLWGGRGGSGCRASHAGELLGWLQDYLPLSFFHKALCRGYSVSHCFDANPLSAG